MRVWGAIEEAINAAMLQIPSHQTADVQVLGLAGHLSRTQQMPRTIISMRTPAQLASCNLRMMSRSLIELFFRIMEAGRPMRAAAMT